MKMYQLMTSDGRSLAATLLLLLLAAAQVAGTPAAAAAGAACHNDLIALRSTCYRPG